MLPRLLVLGLLVLSSCAPRADRDDSFTADSSEGLMLVGMRFPGGDDPLKNIGIINLYVHKANLETDSMEPVHSGIVRPDHCTKDTVNGGVYCFGLNYFAPGNYIAAILGITRGRSLGGVHTRYSMVGMRDSIWGRAINLEIKPSELESGIITLRPGTIAYLGTFEMAVHGHKPVTGVSVDRLTARSFLGQYPNIDADLLVYQQGIPVVSTVK